MIVAIANHKGGVGKTSIAAHLIFRAAELGPVLAIDFDAQGNLTSTLESRDAAVGHSPADALFSDDHLPVPMHSHVPGIDLLPSTAALNSTDRLQLSAAFQARIHLRTLAPRYKMVVIDTAPALGLRLTAALSAAHRLLVPLVPEVYAVDGVSNLLGEAAAIQENLNPELKPADFVLNMMHPQANSHARIAQRISESFRVIRPYLNRSIAVADALADCRPVWTGGRSGGATMQWRALFDQLMIEYGMVIALPQSNED